MYTKAPFKVTNIAIFASGSGTNAQNICNYFKAHERIKVCLIVTDNAKAGVISRASALKIPVEVISKEVWKEGEKIAALLKNYSIDFIVLAGYLKLIPTSLVELFPKRIVNLHPALLPKFGGKGMYGMHVHEAVKLSGENKSGISIHYVNNRFDEGEIIFQAEAFIADEDTPQTIADKIHKLEYEHFPKVIEQVILKNQEAL